MKIAQYPVKCECGDTTTLEVNLFTGEHKIIKPEKKSGYAEMWSVVQHYKTLKGYDQFATWDGQYKARALAASKRILRFFRNHEDPAGLSRELLTDLNAEASRAGWSWTLETAEKRAAEWLAGKLKPAPRKRDE